MAKSKYEYVKKFEENDACLPNTWIVVRIDGRSFHKFTEEHAYEKPNDERGLSLMNECAKCVINEFHDIVIAYGQSDEYSFVFARKSTQFGRRRSKLLSNIVSLFSSSFVFHWSKYFKIKELKYPPQFDSRVILYPALENIRDYLSWRQADCHINNLYNTCFWMLVQRAGLSTTDAENRLKGTLSKDKNELLFSEFDLNYNDVSSIFKKGSVVIRQKVEEVITKEMNGVNKNITRQRSQIIVLHDDVIGETFWQNNPNILLDPRH